MPTDIEVVEANGTLLTMTGVDLPPFAARGLTQTLDHIEQASSLQRSINGEPIDFSAPQFRKYKSTITCTDMKTPLPDDLWPGAEVQVDCVAELQFDPSLGPDRDAVSSSEYVDGGRSFYRPKLSMVVISFTTSTDEYGASVGWQMDLEEI
jgi:hypothetical protein